MSDFIDWLKNADVGSSSSPLLSSDYSSSSDSSSTISTSFTKPFFRDCLNISSEHWKLESVQKLSVSSIASSYFGFLTGENSSSSWIASNEFWIFTDELSFIFAFSSLFLWNAFAVN